MLIPFFIAVYLLANGGVIFSKYKDLRVLR